MNFNAWLKGLGLAVAGAAATAAIAPINNRIQNGRNAPPITGATVGLNAAAGAIVALVGYMVQSPLPVQVVTAPPVQPGKPT